MEAAAAVEVAWQAYAVRRLLLRPVLRLAWALRVGRGVEEQGWWMLVEVVWEGWVGSRWVVCAEVLRQHREGERWRQALVVHWQSRLAPGPASTWRYPS